MGKVFVFKRKVYTPEQFRKYLTHSKNHLVRLSAGVYGIYAGGYFTGRVFGTVKVKELK